MVMAIAVIGSQGQLGRDLVEEFEKSGFKVTALTHTDIEVTDLNQVRSVLHQSAPDFVINTAAFHNVNLCEAKPETAYQVNVLGSRNVAVASAEIHAKTIFTSTDYVFDGSVLAGQFNSPNDPTNPVNTYGKTKREAEMELLDISSENLVFRISSVFGAAGSSGKGGNFIEAILKKVKSGEPAEVVEDTLMSPTYTRTTARIIRNLLELGASGIHHGSSVGQCSWFDLAKDAATKTGLGHLVLPVASQADQTPVRPVNSSLATEGLATLGIENEHWTESVSKYLSEKGYLD